MLFLTDIFMEDNWHYNIIEPGPKYYTGLVKVLSIALAISQYNRKEFLMEILTKVKGWAHALTEVAVSLLGLGIVLEVLVGGKNVPFWPDINVIGNVQEIIAGFSAQGIVGLVAIWVLYHIYKSK